MKKLIVAVLAVAVLTLTAPDAKAQCGAAGFNASYAGSGFRAFAATGGCAAPALVPAASFGYSSFSAGGFDPFVGGGFGFRSAGGFGRFNAFGGFGRGFHGHARGGIHHRGHR